MFCEEVLEILRRDTRVNIVVNLYGDTDGIATADTKTAGENDLVLQSVVVNCFVHQLDDAVRAFDMTRTSDAYLKILT